MSSTILEDLPYGFNESTLGSQEQLDTSLLVSFITALVFASFFWFWFWICMIFWPHIHRVHSKDRKEKPYDWIQRVLTIEDKEILKKAGFDAFLYVSFVRLLFKLILIIGIFNMIVVIPLNVTGSMKDGLVPRWNVTDLRTGRQLTEAEFADFDPQHYDASRYSVTNTTPGHNVSGTAILSLANIDINNDNERWRLVGHTFSVMFSTLVICYFCYDFYFMWAKLRLKQREKPIPSNYTVRITGFDKKLFTEDKIDTIFSRLFSSPVVAIHCVPNIPELCALRKKRYALVKHAEISEAKDDAAKVKLMVKDIDEMEERYDWMRHNPKEWSYTAIDRLKSTASVSTAQFNDIKHAVSSKTLPKVDPATGAQQKIVLTTDPTAKQAATQGNPLNSASNGPRSRIETRRTKKGFYAGVDPVNLTNTAFVTFQYLGDARLCSRAILGEDRSWEITPAVDPKAVIFKNHFPDVGTLERTLRKCLGVVLCAFICIFLIIPIAFAAGLTNFDNLAKIGFLNDIIVAIQTVPYIDNFMSGLLPHLVIMLVFRIITPIIEYITMFLDMVRTKLELQHIMLTRLFAIKTFNVLLGGLLATSFFGIVNQLSSIFQDPYSVFRLVGRTIPKQVNFYLNFILLMGIVDPAYQLLNIERIFWALIRKCRAVSPRQKDNIWKAEEMVFDESYADRLFVFLVILVYSAISPLILIFGFFYFLITLYCDIFQIVYSQEVPFQGHGVIWPNVLDKMFWVMGLHHLVMLGIFVLDGFLFGLFLILITFFCMVTFWFYLRRRFYHLGMIGTTLHELRDKVANAKTTEKFRKSYLHKSLRKIRPHQHPRFLKKKTVTLQDEDSGSGSYSYYISMDSDDEASSNLKKRLSQKLSQMLHAQNNAQANSNGP